ncbi:hypothetical protein [Pseudomonas veronii]|uniref:hypothetical protein n=1 Tax=Pseudomonas veronii TaxID=76761 RepID=UPI0026586E3B|nr:hypothetical protein [Pseudomonas veronii]WKC46938.1 hypothetical protein QYP03_00420 [Pseudomonas veronii]
MAEFIAIPVGQGDAFYLERDGHTILVDGGKNKSAFPGVFCRVTGKDSINTLVCTHNDSDHANGIIGYLNSAMRCDELWLPGRWLEVLPDVLQPIEKVIRLVCEEISEMSARDCASALRIFSNLPNDDHSSFAGESSSRERRPLGSTDEELLGRKEEKLDCGGWPLSMISCLENAENWGDEPVVGHWGWHWHTYHYGSLHGRLTGFVIEAASRIREAALLAFQHGISIRWFEYCPSAPSGGLVGILTPVNAKEIFAMRRRCKTSLTDALSLTVANQESLVFWSPPTSDMPGVLFNADSDLVGVSLSSELENAIATAPHHGSDDNANTYAVVIRDAAGCDSTMTWVRSDCRSRTRPGEVYLGQVGKRYCTLCRPKNTERHKPTREVRFISQSRQWIPDIESRECECKRAV